MPHIIRGRAAGLALNRLLLQKIIIVYIFTHIKVLIVGRTGNSQNTQEKEEPTMRTEDNGSPIISPHPRKVLCRQSTPTRALGCADLEPLPQVLRI